MNVLAWCWLIRRTRPPALSTETAPVILARDSRDELDGRPDPTVAITYLVIGVASWVEDIKIGLRMINVRVKRFSRQRCLGQRILSIVVARLRPMDELRVADQLERQR